MVMHNLYPTLFVSHGAPTLAIQDGSAHRFLAGLGKAIGRPKAILVASAHWESAGGSALSLVGSPATIHDFGGFPPELYELQYPAPGAPVVAEQAARLLEQAGFSVSRSTSRGLDHGAWVPLRLMYPMADIPVAQVALVQGAGPEVHYRLGAALQPLRAQGVLIVGSGSLTHNLYEVMGHREDDAPPAWVTAFAGWIASTLQTARTDILLDYRKQAPYAVENHPTEEHLLPLFVTLGAAGEDYAAERVHTSYTYGVLAMDAYSFRQVSVPSIANDGPAVP